MRKKISIVSVALLASVLLTGCNKTKSFTCSYDLSTEEAKTTMEYKFSFDKKGENLVSYEKMDSIEYMKDPEENEMESVYKSAEDSCADIKDLKGVKCTVEKEDKKITMNVDVKISELDSDGKDTLYTSAIEEKNYDEFRSMMEETGFTCK